MVLADFAFTYKKNVKSSERDSVTEKDYEHIIKFIKESGGEDIHVYYEYDDKRRFHLHGLCLMNTKIKFKMFRFEGFASKWKRCYNSKQWLSYCKKNQKLTESLSHEFTFEVMKLDYETQSQTVPPDECLTPKEMRINPPTKKLF